MNPQLIGVEIATTRGEDGAVTREVTGGLVDRRAVKKSSSQNHDFQGQSRATPVAGTSPYAQREADGSSQRFRVYSVEVRRSISFD